jgi:hypothetical protein
MRWLWWSVIALSVLALAAAWGFWGGWCVDGETFSQCGAEPMVTWEGAVLISILAVGAIIVSATNLRRISHPDRLPTWTAH